MLQWAARGNIPRGLDCGDQIVGLHGTDVRRSNADGVYVRSITCEATVVVHGSSALSSRAAQTGARMKQKNTVKHGEPRLLAVSRACGRARGCLWAGSGGTVILP